MDDYLKKKPFSDYQPLSCENYRKVVLDKGTFERQLYGCWVRANPDVWTSIKEEVPPNFRNPFYAIYEFCF